MRKRTAKSGAAKRTPPQKESAPAAAADDDTPETAPKSAPKTTPKTQRASKTKQAAAKASTADTAAAIDVTPDPTPETKDIETQLAEEKKQEVTEKSPVKKRSAKKPVLSSKSKNDTSNAEPVPEGPALVVETKDDDEEKIVEIKKLEEKRNVVVEATQNEATCVNEQALETNVVENEEDPIEEDLIEETVAEEEEGFVEPSDAELAAGDMEEAEGGLTEVEGNQEPEHDQEGVGVEVDEQIEISDMAKARKIKKEQEIFVGGLDRDATEEDVQKVFEKVGKVFEVRILKDFVTNKNKGFAFVKFATKEEAAKALTELKNPMIRGKRCGVAPSEDNDTLFVGNICNTWTKEAIKRKLKDYGIDTVLSITMVPDTQNEGLSRGFAFVEFPCHADAMVAYKRLQKPDVIFGHPERTAKIAFAVPLREPDPEVMAQVKSVFVDGLPPYWDEDRVREQFKDYGEIERVVLARNMSTAKRKDFGFVNFTTHESAIACIEGINNTELGDGKSKTKARARLANPLPKTQAVKGGMSGGFRIGHGHSNNGGYPRIGRGIGRGRFPSHRAGFQGGRGFVARARGGGRFSFPAGNDYEHSYPEFHGGWRPYEARGGRGIFTSGRRGGFNRGRGEVFPSRRQPFLSEEGYGDHFDAGNHVDDPYFHGDGGHGIKRPYSMMEFDPGYLDPGSRLRPRYDYPDPMTSGTRYRDPPGMTGPYSRDYNRSDYYRPDYGGYTYGNSTYSSRYGGESSRSGYYY